MPLLFPHVRTHIPSQTQTHTHFNLGICLVQRKKTFPLMKCSSKSMWKLWAFFPVIEFQSSFVHTYRSCTCTNGTSGKTKPKKKIRSEQFSCWHGSFFAQFLFFCVNISLVFFSSLPSIVNRLVIKSIRYIKFFPHPFQFIYVMMLVNVMWKWARKSIVTHIQFNWKSYSKLN